ncbi:hypothetical protein TcWFU_004442 [Taenia crassiceps]|uniref:Uncharacterized protein n=1 Tax=Taenia crassiceps TaxID=6207 RepID=A0ABR4QHQ3_9CEST
MGGRGSKSDSECDCCSECAALHENHPTWVQKPRTRRLHPNANAHQLDGCRGDSFFNGPENLRINLEEELSFPSPQKNEYDLLIEKNTGIEANFSSLDATVDLPSLKASSPMGTPKQSSKLLIEKTKTRVEKPKFRWNPKTLSKRNVFFQGATPCGDEDPHKFHTPRQTPWPNYLRQGVPLERTSSKPRITSSALAMDFTSPYFEDTYRGPLPHECGRCITEQDVMSLFEFESLERECDVACMERLPPVPKARKTRMIHHTPAEIAAPESIA